MFLSQAAYAICTLTYGGKIHASNMTSITAEIYTTLGRSDHWSEG